MQASNSLFMQDQIIYLSTIDQIIKFMRDQIIIPMRAPNN